MLNSDERRVRTIAARAIGAFGPRAGKAVPALIPAMVERGFGRIINLSSGIRDIPQLAPYSVSKAAVDKYTSDLAAELRGSNVLVNGLDPGWLKTDLGGPDADYLRL